MLDGQVAIITGSSRGIGRATAELFAKNGAKVVITGRDEALLREVADNINAADQKRCVYHACDMGDLEESQKLFDLAMESFGRLDILVCNAGMALREPSLDMSLDNWKRVMDVNLTAPLVLARICLKHFRERKSGKVVFVSSGAAKNPHLGASPSYGASKAGLVYLTRHFAAEFVKDNVRVNAVAPGPVDTDITKSWSPEHRAKVLANLPMGRLGLPIDIAYPILFLASDMSAYINGECLAVNGGTSMD